MGLAGLPIGIVRNRAMCWLCSCPSCAGPGCAGVGGARSASPSPRRRIPRARCLTCMTLAMRGRAIGGLLA
ncbi:hypothetical protein A3768_4337 (plasmid) [Ralstonia solanacearum]|nr:hypothetical protein F504_5151 [Ralstonia pseudosolanacearum FQY_4]ANH35154.1 hypothetical protein A3768_4337 [Ralstonia solanacearum]